MLFFLSSPGKSLFFSSNFHILVSEADKERAMHFPAPMARFHPKGGAELGPKISITLMEMHPGDD